MEFACGERDWVVARLSVSHMSDKTTTGCYRELGAELRRVREVAGLTEEELGQQLGWSGTKVSRSECGYVRLNEMDVILYLAFCGVYGVHGSDQRAMCREAEANAGHWIRRYATGWSDATRSLVFHENTASGSTSYEPMFVPGLLQTEGYIRALTGIRWPNCDIDFAVHVRTERQRILQRPSAGSFTFFVHENALRVRLGDAGVMHEQVLALLLLDGLPNVAIRVVPTETGARGLFGGPFRVFEYTKYQPLVYLDSPVCGVFLEDREYVDDYCALLPTVANNAMNEKESREMLAALASEWDREGANPDGRDPVKEG